VPKHVLNTLFRKGGEIMNITENLPKIQTPVSKSEASTLSKGNTVETSDSTSNPETSFRQLLQQKGQEPSTEESNSLPKMEQLCSPLEIATGIASDTQLYQELVVAMMGSAVILPQIQQMVTTGEPLPQLSSSAAQPLAPQSVAQPIPTGVPTAFSTAPGALQPETPTPISKVQQTQVSPGLVPTAPQQPQAQQPVASIQQTDQGGASKQDDGETAELPQGEGALSKPLFQSSENLPVKVGETPTLHTDSPDFTQQLGKQLNQTLAQGAQKIALQLSPEHLGTMLVEFTRSQDGTLRVVLQASNPQAASLLNQHTAGLSTLLQSSTQVPVYVEVQQQQDASQSDQQNQQQNHGQGNQQDARHQRQQQQNQDFLEQLRLGMVSLGTEVS
jgi:flagellar hook-length control protein FliK